MSNKLCTIKERILHVLEIKGIVKDKFFTKIGMTYGNFTGKAKLTPLNSVAISNILLEIPDISPDWLLTGNGPMLRDEQGRAASEPSVPPPSTDAVREISIYKELLADRDKTIEKLNREIGTLIAGNNDSLVKSQQRHIDSLKQQIRDLMRESLLRDVRHAPKGALESARSAASHGASGSKNHD